MFLNFKNKKISAIVSILPENESYFDDEIENYNFPVKNSLKLKKLMGFKKHRIVKNEVCATDLAIKGFRQLFEDKIIKKEDIDAIIYVTQSPNHFGPQSSVIMLKELDFPEDMITYDLSQGCAGFVQGLFQAFWLLNSHEIKKVAIITTDVLSRKLNKRDRSSYPLVGDGAAITIVENNNDSSSDNHIYAYNKTIASGAMVINIPAGGFRMPSTEKTAIEKICEDGNIRSLDNSVMDGASVFSFMQERVPQMVYELLDYANLTKKDIDSYMFHQPNKFMLETLADTLKISYQKMPNNVVENFGNSSSATIPINICYNLKNIITKKPQKVFFAGFGIGLTLSGIIMDLPIIPYLKMIDYKED